MAMAGIADDIVKGVKKFGKEVVEGAKDGPGKAARIKKTAVLRSNGGNINLDDALKQRGKDVEDIIARGRKDIKSLSGGEKRVFDAADTFDDSSGKIKNYNEVIAKEMDRVKNLSDNSEVIKGLDRLDALTGQNIMVNRPTGMSDENWANATRHKIGTLIEPGTKTAGRIAGDFAGGGIYGSYNAYKNMADGKKSIMGAIKEGHSVVNDAGEKVISGKRVAGTAVTAAGAASLGNRVFRDEYGELDIPVVPFI